MCFDLNLLHTYVEKLTARVVVDATRTRRGINLGYRASIHSICFGQTKIFTDDTMDTLTS